MLPAQPAVVWALALLTVGVSCRGGYVPDQSQRRSGGSDLRPPYEEDSSTCGGGCPVSVLAGQCRVDADCRVRRPGQPGVGHSSADPAGGRPEEGTAPRSPGCCLYEDGRRRCRLDHVCLLDRDTQATEQLFREQSSPRRAAELLSSDDGNVLLREILESSPLPCDRPCWVRDPTNSSDCKIDSSCKYPAPVSEGSSGGENDFVPSIAGIIDSPFLDCPGPCEVRDEDGICVEDISCPSPDV